MATTVAGLVIDVVTHAGARSPSGALAAAGHLLTLAGMVVALTAVMWMGARTSRSTSGGGRGG